MTSNHCKVGDVSLCVRAHGDTTVNFWRLWYTQQALTARILPRHDESGDKMEEDDGNVLISAPEHDEDVTCDS